MSDGRIMLDNETSALIEAAGREFTARILELIGAAAPEGLGATVFTASVSVQACIRGMVRPDDDELCKAVLLGAAEGVGAILGLIPDPVSRTQLVQACLNTMRGGVAAQAQIHDTEGTA